MISLEVNGRTYQIDTSPEVPLLWVIRENLGLTGTKYGCGKSFCGACTVLIDGKAERSCQIPVKDAQGKRITTIEGIPEDHPVKRAWNAEDVPQCGYCQPGQIMDAVALLDKNPNPTDADIDRAMSSNLCRCGTYQRIRQAIRHAAGMTAGTEKTPDTHNAEAHEVQSVPSFELNPYVRIRTDGSVVILLNKSEMGQGVYTALPMLVAEELEVEWSKIRVEAAPVARPYYHAQWGEMMGTGGSTSVLSEWKRYRTAGATARTMLVQAAADLWQVDPAICRCEEGFVIHKPTDRRLPYGKLAERAALIKPPESVPLKRTQDFKVIGKPMKRLDTPEKTSGKALFGIDVKIPGMLTALITRPPFFGGKVKSFTAERAKAVAGVREVIEVDSGVAVIGDTFWAAKLGREALEIAWEDRGPGAKLSTERMREEYRDLAKNPGSIARKEGRAEEMLRSGTSLIAEYEVPYLAHAPMETLNCLVDLRPDG